jgi:hypothetical protein
MAYPDSCVSGSGKRIKAVGVTGRITGKLGSNPKVRFADKPPGISVSLQVEHKQFIGNGHLIDSSLR